MRRQSNLLTVALFALTLLLAIFAEQLPSGGRTNAKSARDPKNNSTEQQPTKKSQKTSASSPVESSRIAYEPRLTGNHLQSDLTPESAVRADIAAQNAGDWDTYWNLRNKMHMDDGMRANVISARLESLTSVPIAVAGNLIGPPRYIDTLINPQSFYVIVDYEVRQENKYICNGSNARLYVLDYVGGGWKIIQVSEPPIITLVENGFGIGSASEKELIDRQEVRLQTGQFLNSRGQVIFSNGAAGGELPLATDTVPPSCITVALTDNPEGGSTNIIGYKKVPFNDYIADVLPNEWSLSAQFDAYPESLKAGAMAIKTYGWWWNLFPRGPNFDVYDSTANQVYRENSRSTNSAYVGALTATQNTGMSKSADLKIFQAQYWNGLVNVPSGGANIHSGPALTYPVINTASGGEQLAVVNGGTNTADGYRWWKIKKAGYPPPTNGVGYVAGSLLVYQTSSGPVSIDTFQNGTFIGQLTQYGTKYWAYTGDSYQTILTRFYNSTSPKTGYQNIRFFTINVGSCSSLTISTVNPTAVQTRDWGQTVSYTINVVDNNGSAVSGATVNVSDGLQSFSTFTSPTNSNGQTIYTTTVPSGKADGTYDVAFTATKSGYNNSSSVTRQVQVRHLLCSAITDASTKLTSTGATLNGAVNLNGCTATPTATLTTRSVSATDVQVNQSFSVSTSLMVNNATADHAGISISFPSLTNSGISGSPPSESYNSAQGTVTTSSSLSITGGSTLQYWGAGESLTCASGSLCPAQHLLVEGDWATVGAGSTRSLNLTVTPKAAGTFKVRIRGWATAPIYQNPSRDPSSGTTDQQNFPVYEITVTASSCSYSISSTSQNFGSSGGSNNVGVTAGGGCAWTAVSNSSFITITSASSGSGNGTVSYSVSANSSTSQRTGTMTIAGQTFTVTQSGASCSYSISPTSQSFGSSGGSNNVGVTAGGGCAWTAVSNSSFITINSGSSGSGNGTVSYSVSSNSSTSQRTGTMTIAGQTFNVTQSGLSCSYSISPTSQSFGSSGGSNNVGVTASAGCAWTAVSNSSFITITSGSSGSGNGTVNYSVSANSSTSQRTGTMTIGGQTFNVTQSGASCNYSISPTSQSFGSSGGSNNVGVTASAGCAWTAVSNSSFITITSGSSGSGNGTVSYSVASNSGNQRSGTLGIAGQTFTVNQGAASAATVAYDAVLRAPKCGQPGSVCDSGTLLNGRGNITGGQEPNQPNTIYNSCSDNTIGTYHLDESIDRIKVSTPDGSNLASGKTVKIEATVWAFSPTDDFLDLFYAPDASNPNWTYITTLVPSTTGIQVLSTTFTLPSGGTLQAVRANFLYQGAATPCSGGSGNYDDHDDLIFATSSSGSSSIQISSSSYTVNEGLNPRVDIALTRSGDTTSSASVSFATNDSAGLQNCNVVNGIASPRCDYANTIGTVQFGAGETSKSFSVAIVNDSYAEGNETFTISLSNPSGATLGTQSTATATIIDNDGTNGSNPMSDTNFFVRQQYIDFLGREPDPPGLAGWTSTINNCSGDTTQCDRIHVSQLFFQSDEFQSRGYFVYRFYPAAFGRKPDYAEFVPDLSRVSGFLDANQLEAAKVAFIADFMARPAFANTYNPLTNTQYVDTLLSTAAVTLPAATRTAMINGLNGATLTRAQVLRQIVESSEVSTKYNHQAYAVMEYFGYLRRQPDSFYLDWIAELDRTNNPRGMVTGFVTSAEYRQRFGP